MVKSLESFIAETQKSYEPAKQALQQQIDAIDPQLAKAQASINANYNNQQATLNRNRDLAAESASMQAAGSGGSFGGAANLANRKYYQQSFVPAQQSLNTNRASSLDQAQQQAEANRLSLQSQLANLTSEANRYATQRYDAAVEAERQRAAQRAAIAAQNAYNKYLIAAQQGANGNGYRAVQDGSKWTYYNPKGGLARLGEVINASGQDFNSALYDQVSTMANSGDAYAKQLKRRMDNGARFAYNSYGNWGSAGSTGDNIYDTFGIRSINGW